MITIEEVKSYLKIDNDEEDVLLKNLISVAEEYLFSAIGSISTASKRGQFLALVVVGDLYENRERTEKVGATTRKLVSDFLFQLRLESEVEV